MLDTYKRFDADVVICGGGCAGFTAGVAAARAGKRTILLEWRESLGGLFTNGYITGAAGCVDGIGKEFYERMDANGDALMNPHSPVIEPERGKIMMEQMLLQAGCRILYGTHVVDCEVVDGRITKVIAYCKSGKVEISGKVFIDATGDADLAFAAGVPCEVSSAEYCGLSQSATMGFRLSYVNEKKFREADAEWRATRDQRKYRSLIVGKEYEALENGDLPEILSPGNIVFTIPTGRSTELTDVTMDATHTFDCRCDDVVDLSRQIVDQHNKVLLFVDFLKKYVPGFEECVLTNLAPMNGIRDSRRIVGEYIFKDIDLASARKFEDGIAQFCEPYDTHVPTPGVHTAIRHIHHKEPVPTAVCRPSQDHDNMMFHPFVKPDPNSYELRTDPREYCEIPYRSLVAVGVDNLMAIGRCYSAEFHALGATRIIGPSMSMGHAAGIAAGMAIDNKCALRDVDGKLVREEMIRQGANLHQPPVGYWQDIREKGGEPVVTASDMVVIM